MKIFNVWILVVIIRLGLNAQSFTGGDGDGVSFVVYNETDQLFYTGGNGDGFSIMGIVRTPLFYSGGNGDGFSSVRMRNLRTLFYAGGTNDGFSTANWMNNGSLFYTGSVGDGFDLSFLPGFIIWTGLKNTDWNEPGNWEPEVTPSYVDRVRIPTEPLGSIFPLVTDGNFIIGDSGGTFQAKSILMDPLSSLITNRNCFITNKGVIVIGGDFLFRNNSSLVFDNQGEVIIENGGQLSSDF